MRPVGVHTKALEAVALHVDEALGPLAAELAHLGLARLGHLLRAELLLNLVLDGLTVAVPTGNVGGVEAALRMRLYDEVLEDLVERVADVDGAVGIGRAVVENEGLAVLVLLENLVIDIELFPLLETLRLILRQIGAHGEVGPGKVHGVLIAVSHETFQPFV